MWGSVASRASLGRGRVGLREEVRGGYWSDPVGILAPLGTGPSGTVEKVIGDYTRRAAFRSGFPLGTGFALERRRTITI